MDYSEISCTFVELGSLGFPLLLEVFVNVVTGWADGVWDKDLYCFMYLVAFLAKSGRGML